MNVWNAFPFVRYSFALVAGILLYTYVPDLWKAPVITFSFLLAVVIAVSFIQRDRHLYLSRVLSGFFQMILLAFLGGILLSQKDHRNRVDHFMRIDDKVLAYSGKISSDHYDREKYHRYEFALQEVLLENGTQRVSGTIYLYVRKDSLSEIIPYGSVLCIKGKYTEIDPPGNPDQFDYRTYLTRKNIFGQAFVDKEQLDIVDYAPSNPILAFAYSVRSRSSQMISQFIPGESASAVMNALLIGVKDFLDHEIKEAYSSAGAMHVLAVSGLHVGIVYLLITVIFGQLKKKRRGRLFFVLISLLTIWTYALITGFSPSVMRASTMFSLIIIGESSKRNINIYNSLGLAAFILLVYNPYFIFDVGFQLSFIAVFGIVTFQPPIYRLWEPQNMVLDYFWAIVSVSVAAQLVTFPLSLYYFNQFPTYFLAANVIIIPAAMVMLTSGLFMLGVGSISLIAGETVGFMVGSFVELVNWLILKIQMVPWSTISWIYLSSFSVLLIYLCMVFGFFGLRNRNFNDVAFSMVCLFLLVLNFNYEIFVNGHQHRLVVYQDDEHLAIDLIKGTQAHLITHSPPNEVNEMAAFQINPHRLASGLNAYNSEQTVHARKTKYPGVSVYVWDGIRIMVLSEELPNDLKPDEVIDTDLLILQTFRTELLNSFHYKYLILSQMSWRERQRAINHFEKEKIEYFDMFERGYFELDLKNLKDQISYH